ncbi:hypothetical protein BDA99DRAFT_538415 [Phascolomyces articulosus]|uniref:Uncharacterized protein n=1 Tax=Phascolomyces articulosus TaxID=60185 RepID=A0AAD5PCY2_9FUNG|nr:hypothetical protein BDA99DRAFT_538415 [Phascolomyces articulosus]
MDQPNSACILPDQCILEGYSYSGVIKMPQPNAVSGGVVVSDPREILGRLSLPQVGQIFRYRDWEQIHPRDAISIRMAGLDDKSKEAKGISLLSVGLDMVWRIRATNPDRRIQLDQATQPTTDIVNDGSG